VPQYTYYTMENDMFFFDNKTNNYDSYVVDESVQCQHLLFFKWAPAVGFGETGFTVQL